MDKEPDKRGSITSVNPIEYEGEVSYYVISYENGWDMISSDKRGPMILGRSENGVFDYERMNPSQQTWIDCLCEDIYYRRHFEEEYYEKAGQKALEKEKSSIEFWLTVTSNPDYISLFIEPVTKVAPQIDDSGHWEVFYEYLWIP